MMGVIFFGLATVTAFLAFIRVLKKRKNGETVHVEPVGAFKDLPDTVTGMQKRK